MISDFAAEGRSRAAAGRELVEYGRELERQGAAQVEGTFTRSTDADALLRENPNAFLLGVLFTQGIPAERAWSGPWLLKQRLGHLDLERLSAEPDAVRSALQQPPMLHRFKETLPSWITLASRRLLEEWGGDAARIWAPGTHVLEVTERLSAFDGIGRKKAVMATEILARHLGADLVGRECGQVAYDVQVRRVFLRAGLIERDTREEVEAAARATCPEAPGTLDLATWLVGRTWCRPKSPLCDRCRLSAACPRRVSLGAEGVGVRRGVATRRSG